MNYGKAVEEVWQWREAFEEKLRMVPKEKQVKYINDTARDACKRLGIKCRTAAPRLKSHA
ncbi:MAG: hypothetical protein DRP52_06395 [Planctomycetota bacterium]|nr:MAG: hypothetical protein DRP52_06395 [Planctomycetota bacterium]